MIANHVERGRYLDSVALMHISRRLEALDGVEAAALMIGSPSNKALLREADLLGPEGQQAGANDLIIAVRANDTPAAAHAVGFALEQLARPPTAASAESLPRASTLAGALAALPEANLALISVPGEFAAYEARKALERGLHVLVFSDNVPLEDEAALKRLAAERQLLAMGPDCGTALIAGTPLAFANALPRGNIGIVSASGTGLQEVSCLIARMGGGISHGIGVGGRDLEPRIGALGTLAAMQGLEDDPATARIILISKPPAPEVAQRVLERARRSTKPCIVCFLGLDPAHAREQIRGQSPIFCPTLTAAAEAAMGTALGPFPMPRLTAPKQSTVAALYCGGTLCAEAELVFQRKNLSGHRFMDLGADAYTRARPHPMIAPEMRNEHIARAVADPQVGVLLVDLVLGYGAHENPAAVLVRNDFSSKIVIASVTGTDQDPQVWSRQVALLREAGVLVAASNAHAAAFAAGLVA